MALVLVGLDPQRQRNAGGLQRWQVKDEHSPYAGKKKEKEGEMGERERDVDDEGDEDGSCLRKDVIVTFRE